MTIWVVIEEDRGLGTAVVSAHLTANEAYAAAGSHEWVQEVDLLTTKKNKVE
jgi:hypothetical protein